MKFYLKFQILLRPQRPQLFYINKARVRVTMWIRNVMTEKPAARTRR